MTNAERISPKGIVAVDIPESCEQCRFFQNIYCDMICKVNGRTINYPFPKAFRQEWCPIQQIPEKDRENYARADSYWQKQVLEKILQEIDEKIEVAEKIIVRPPHDKLDEIANDTAEAFIEAYKECQDIIRSCMEDDE